MNSMSILDTLAHQISTIYKCKSFPIKIYIYTARDLLTNTRLGQFLNSQLGSQWFTEFEPYRHCTTHESLIKTADCDISYDQIAKRYQLSKPIRLPDDPQLIPFTYNKNREAIEYCGNLFNNIQSLIEGAYDNILIDIRSNGNVVPILC